MVDPSIHYNANIPHITRSGEVARSLGYLSAVGWPGSGAVSAQGLHI